MEYNKQIPSLTNKDRSYGNIYFIDIDRNMNSKNSYVEVNLSFVEAPWPTFARFVAAVDKK